MIFLRSEKNVSCCVVILVSLLTYGDILSTAFAVPSRNTEALAPNREHEYLIVSDLEGKRGGTLLTAHRSEPRTFNPLVAMDGSSKEIIGLLTADLIHINRYTQRTEPALARSWELSRDGRQFTVHLRRGLQFSDGYSFNADDVLFTFQAYLDEHIHSPQRDLLNVGGKPIRVDRADAYTVVFTLAQPYGAAERLFDSIAILPKHILERAYQEGKLAESWNLNTPATQIAGLGPFQLRRYSPEGITLERNPFYWKRDTKGNQLPYLDRIVSLALSTPEAEELRFQGGDLDVISRFDAQDFSTLQRTSTGRNYRLYDAGPGLEYCFLLFNLNDIGSEGGPILQKQKWFRQTAFRRALSSVVDRDSMIRLAYSGRAYPLSVQTSPGNRAWLDTAIPRPERSIELSRNILRRAHFAWAPDGILHDSSGEAVEFSVMYNSGKPQQERIAAIIQEDLKEIGINANPVPIDFTGLVNRVFDTFRYETAIMTLADGDADPNTEMNVLLSTGQTHVWKMHATNAPEAWQSEIDRMMREQMVTIGYARRKQLFDRVQEIMWEEQPVIFLLSPDILAGAAERVGNFQPALLSSYTLWNADQLFIRTEHDASTHR